jgi:hypothetical protein
MGKNPFNPAPHHTIPMAYLITFTCYGARLHVNSKGSVNRRHNIPGSPALPHERLRAQLAPQWAAPNTSSNPAP